MRTLISRRRTTSSHSLAICSPLHLSFVVVRAGRTTAQAIAVMQLSERLSPLFLGEAIASNVTISGQAQAEALFYIVSHVSPHSPRGLAWLLEMIAQCVAKCSTGSLQSTAGITTWLAKQPLLRQVTAVGLHGNVASALAASTVQITMHACFLVKRSVSNVKESHLAFEQFYYDCVTALSASGASVLGGSCGAMIGGLLVPGIGTALGSLFGSMGGGLVPYMLRCRGPDAERAAALQICSSQRALNVVEDDSDWLVVTECEEESQFVFFDQLSGVMSFGEKGPSMIGGATNQGGSGRISDVIALEEDAEARIEYEEPHLHITGSVTANDFEFIDDRKWKKAVGGLSCDDDNMHFFVAMP